MKKILQYQPGQSRAGAIKLSSNESPFPPSEKMIAAMHKALEQAHRYPQSTQTELRHILSAQHHITPTQLVFGNGSDEILTFIAQSILKQGDETITAEHTFSVYTIVTQQQDAHVNTVPLQQGYFDLDMILEKINTRTKIIFICNPNNPTGTCHTGKSLTQFISKIPHHIYIVLDAAYMDFAEIEYHVSPQVLLALHPNLMILKTFSKFYALGGARIGYCITHEHIANMLEIQRMPFNVNVVAYAGAIAALSDHERCNNTISLIHQERRTLLQAYAALGCFLYPSQANFFAIKPGGHTTCPANEAFEYFADHGIMVRSLQSFGLDDTVRITIGQKHENKLVVDVLTQWQKHLATYDA